MQAEVRVARVVEAVGRYRSGRLSCPLAGSPRPRTEAAEVLGIGERHFRRLRDRYEAEGAEGLIDRRRGRISGQRVAVDRIEWVLEKYRTRDFDFTVKPFHERLVSEDTFELGTTWTKRVLQTAGLVKRAPRRSAHRKKRPDPLPVIRTRMAVRQGVFSKTGQIEPDRGIGICPGRPLPGMMLFQDGSPHRWLGGQPPCDLVVTMDDATSTVDSAILVEEEGTASSFLGLAEVIGDHGLLSSLYTDRGSHDFHTPKAGGKVAKDQPTQSRSRSRAIG